MRSYAAADQLKNLDFTSPLKEIETWRLVQKVKVENSEMKFNCPVPLEAMGIVGQV